MCMWQIIYLRHSKTAEATAATYKAAKRNKKSTRWDAMLDANCFLTFLSAWLFYLIL